MLEDMAEGDSELISIYYGEDISKEDAASLLEKVEERFPDIEVELEKGDQPVYYYIVSVE